jgi:hypothetical protein
MKKGFWIFTAASPIELPFPNLGSWTWEPRDISHMSSLFGRKILSFQKLVKVDTKLFSVAEWSKKYAER